MPQDACIESTSSFVETFIEVQRYLFLAVNNEKTYMTHSFVPHGRSLPHSQRNSSLILAEVGNFLDASFTDGLERSALERDSTECSYPMQDCFSFLPQTRLFVEIFSGERTDGLMTRGIGRGYSSGSLGSPVKLMVVLIGEAIDVRRGRGIGRKHRTRSLYSPVKLTGSIQPAD